MHERDLFIDGHWRTVNRRHELTLAQSIISTFYRADRR